MTKVKQRIDRLTFDRDTSCSNKTYLNEELRKIYLVQKFKSDMKINICMNESRNAVLKVLFFYNVIFCVED